jgi:glutathione S-transferase
MLLWEKLTRPQGLVRSPAAQAEVDLSCRHLALYQFKTCPFCIKVRQEMVRLSLDIEQRDAQHDGPYRAELIAGGGRAMVPCLRIEDATGKVAWLYESSAIIEYLHSRFGQGCGKT